MNYIFYFIKILICFDTYSLLFLTFIKDVYLINNYKLLIDKKILNFLLLIKLNFKKFLIIYLLKNNYNTIIYKIKYIFFILKKKIIIYLYNILKNNKLKAPSLNIYYPIESSLFSITLRITGILIVFVFLILYFMILFLMYLN